MGNGTHDVSVKMFAQNRSRLVDRLREKNQTGVVMLMGGIEKSFYDTDTTYNEFRQESYFMWAFGVTEAKCFAAIQVTTGRSILFVPHYDPSYAVWMGPLWTLSDFKAKYEVDEVHYVDNIAKVLKGLNPTELLTLYGKNSDSGLSPEPVQFEGIEEFTINKTVLYDEMADLRVIKTPMELEVMRYVTLVSSNAHKEVMKLAVPGSMEYQAEAEFKRYCYSVGGCRQMSYTCICGSGPNGAILHYGHAGAPNDRGIQAGEMVLFDMGGNYFGYAADVTCSFPVSGKFSADQKLIYEAVLTSNLAVFEACKPGVQWSDMHNLSIKVLLRELKAGGLLRGDVNEMHKAGLGYTFMPHGLGHLIGLDVHDVGAYLPNQPQRPQEPRGADRLRTNRVLQAGMCLTIEPGCYFIDPLLDEALGNPELAKFLVPEQIARFRGKGGVRIEDDVEITETGCSNMTKVPRTVAEIESFISQARK